MLAKIRDRILESFAGRAPLSAVFLFPGPTTDYEVLVFYKSNADIEACRANGNEQAIRDAILREFAATANDKRVPPTVAFKFDSYENVRKRSNGNYGLYLK
jgi:hypothetical protein